MLLKRKWKHFFKLPVHDKLILLHRRLSRLKALLYYKHVFASFGSGSVLFKPLLLSYPRFIHVGKNSLIRQGVRMEVIPRDHRPAPEMRIGDNVNIEQNVHLVCHSRLVIGNNVSITGHCAIVDVTHPYTDVNDPLKIGDRILDENSFVEIGDGSFLGFGALVMPNVRIGRYCIIGAHSVVTKDVPDYSVVAGNPAKTLRYYDAVRKQWIEPQ